MVDETEVADASIELREDDEYGLHAYGKLVIEGPLGKLVALKTYRASPNYDDLMPDDEIHEHIKYYHDDSNYENQPYTDGGIEWNPANEAALEDEDAFLEECEAAMMGDPQTEYETALEGTRYGISDALEDAHHILAASAGQQGLTEAQAEAYALREVHDVPRKWAAIAVGKDPSNVDNLQRSAREKVNTIQQVAEAIETVKA